MKTENKSENQLKSHQLSCFMHEGMSHRNEYTIHLIVNPYVTFCELWAGFTVQCVTDLELAFYIVMVNTSIFYNIRHVLHLRLNVVIMLPIKWWKDNLYFHRPSDFC